MTLINSPAGRAREYSPLSLNIYSSCDGGCTYCFTKTIPWLLSGVEPFPKPHILENLEKELSRKRITKQVLLSFTGDPYCMAETRGGTTKGGYGITRKVLEILNAHDVPVAILTKGGRRCLRDLDLFKQFKRIKVGATLTFHSDADSLEWEPGATLPDDRLDALSLLHTNGIATWASFEPVIAPEQSLALIKMTLPYVDQYKLGRWNHDPRADAIDWPRYVAQAVQILRQNGKQLYVKDDLRKYASGLTAEESDMDFMSLEAEAKNESQLALF